MTANTSRSVATSRRKRDTVLKSTGAGTPGTLLPCRTYSTHGPSYKTSGRPCGATNHRVGIECVGPTGRGFSLDQARDPRQQTGHARGRPCHAIMTRFGCTGARADFSTRSQSLFVLYTPERQVDTWLSHAGFLGHFVLEVLLRVASHDKEAAVRQSLRKCDGAIFSLELEQASRAQTDGGDHGSHLRLRIRVQANAVIAISIQIAKQSVVAQLRQTRVGISRHGGGLFDVDF